MSAEPQGTGLYALFGASMASSSLGGDELRNPVELDKANFRAVSGQPPPEVFVADFKLSSKQMYWRVVPGLSTISLLGSAPIGGTICTAASGWRLAAHFASHRAASES